MTEIAKDQKDLAARTKERAGGAAALARLLGQKKSTVSAWGRTRAIPKWALPVLMAYDTTGRIPSKQATVEEGPRDWLHHPHPRLNGLLSQIGDAFGEAFAKAPTDMQEDTADHLKRQAELLAHRLKLRVQLSEFEQRLSELERARKQRRKA